MHLNRLASLMTCRTLNTIYYIVQYFIFIENFARCIGVEKTQKGPHLNAYHGEEDVNHHREDEEVSKMR